MGKKKLLCSRCGLSFPTAVKLKTHGRKHKNVSRDIEMLRSGKRPAESKIGMKFRGKNRVIIS